MKLPKTRIKVEHTNNGTIYYPQCKFLGFWVELLISSSSSGNSYSTSEVTEALDTIDTYLENIKKRKGKKSKPRYEYVKYP